MFLRAALSVGGWWFFDLAVPCQVHVQHVLVQIQGVARLPVMQTADD
ncbi:MAG TPA: hypothetical protein VLA42_02590 [Verrucomicrobiae bacterium]|jgi:hypothetical protein|nr:hypothetical protein [Verrucomicrobiae bacterium]